MVSINNAGTRILANFLSFVMITTNMMVPGVYAMGTAQGPDDALLQQQADFYQGSTPSGQISAQSSFLASRSAVELAAAPACSTTSPSNTCNLDTSPSCQPTYLQYSPAPIANPALAGTCGLNIALVLDGSGSISGPLPAGNNLATILANGGYNYGGTNSNPTYQADVVAGVTSFINDLQNTGANVAIVEFGGLADIPVKLTGGSSNYIPVTPSNVTKYFTPYLTPCSASGVCYHNGRADLVDESTDWMAGLLQVQNLRPAPDLIVFITDGQPNDIICSTTPANTTCTCSGSTCKTSSGATCTTAPLANTTCSCSSYGCYATVGTNGEISATDFASEIANNLKTPGTNPGNGVAAGNQGNGSHIFTIGIGAIAQSNTINGNSIPNIDNLEQLTDGISYCSAAVPDGSGAVLFKSGPPNNFATADYAEAPSATDYGYVSTGLSYVAGALCNASVTVNKWVDNTGNGTYVLSQTTNRVPTGWGFNADISLTPSSDTYTWSTPSSGTANGLASGTTSPANGQLFFQWVPSNINDVSEVTVSEVEQPGYTLKNVTCTEGANQFSPAVNNNAFTLTGAYAIYDLGALGPTSANCDVYNQRTGGSITIVKQANPSDSTPFAFTTSGSGLSGFSLVPAGANSKTFPTLVNGTYSFTETSTPGWALSGLSCSGGANTSTNLNSRTATVKLSAGENVTCTFTNTEQGTIIVKKVTSPTGRPETFAFTGDAAGFISDGQTIVVNNLNPGQYTSTESAAANFTLSSIVCDDNASVSPSTGDIATSTATFNLQPGETITCTFTNTLVKQTPTVASVIHNASESSITSGAPGIIVHDTATVIGGNLGTPTGTVTFSFFNNSTCSGSAQASSSALTLTNGSINATAFPQGPLNAGSYSFQATYNGDVNYNTATGPCEPLIINPDNDSIATQLKLAADNSNLPSSISTGTIIYDTATLSGTTPSAGGTVTYTVYTNSSCSVVDASHSASQVTVTNAIVPQSPNYTFNNAGTFYVQASYSGDINNTSAKGACDPVNVVAPNLAISKTADSASIIPGATIGYTVTVSNSGPGSATGTTLTDSLPSLAGFNWAIDLSNSDSGCSISVQGVLSCSFGNLPSGASKKVHVTTTTTTDQSMCGTHNNSASAQASNNAQVSVGPVPVTVNCIQGLSVSKTDNLNPGTYDHVGQIVSFTIKATNTGNATLTNVSVTDNPSLSGYSCNPASPVASLPPGAVITCSGTHAITQADLDAGSFVDTASATSDQEQAPNASDTISARQNKLLTLTKTDNLNPTKFNQAGQVVTFTITATNSGNFTLHNINVTDAPALDGYACTPALPVAALAPGAFVVCKGTHTTSQADLDAGIFTDVASATSTEVNAANATDSIYANDTPHLKITKIALQSGYDAVGNVIHYSITVTNDGNVTLPSATVIDALVGDLSCAPSNGSGLAPLASLTCTASHTITQADIDAGLVTNTACVNGLPALQACGQVAVNAVQNKLLTITKIDDLNPGTYDHVGQVVNFTITATNSGNYSLHNVNVVDNPALDSMNCLPQVPAAILVPGAQVICTGSHSITQSDLNAGRAADAATATSDDTAPVSASDTLQVGLGKLTLIEAVVDAHGGNATPASFVATAAGESTLTLSGASSVSGQVIDGSYTLTEVGPANYTLTLKCVDGQGNQVGNGNMVNVPAGGDITCTFQNEDNAPQLHLINTVDNIHGRTATADQWTLTARGMGEFALINGALPVGLSPAPIVLSGQTPVNSDGTLKADTYALSASGPANYTQMSVTCVNANGNSVPLASGNQVTLNLGDNVTCTFAQQDNIIPNLVVDPGCNCDSTGSMSSSNMLNMALLLGFALFMRRRFRVKARKD